ncbi:MAG: MBOAT family protein [Oscillospiraceae bacterium]|nr:MBOAT family protein [Oscillospiraceae bacterium]
MNFDSAFFLFCFFPVLLLLHAVLRGTRARNILLLAAGLLFYAFGQLSGLLLLLASAAGNYLLGLLILRGGPAQRWVRLGVVLNLAFLGAYKYLDFFVCGLLGVPDFQSGLAAPIGISFFTFKAISYLIDAGRDTAQGTRSPMQTLLYLSFFPQIMAGPLTRFADFRAQLGTRRVTLVSTAQGLRRFVFGLAKKLILSAALGEIADAVFALTAPDFRLAWLGALSYMLQMFFDFAGYSDMALGLGQVFGFSTPENFDYPYISASITEFWRRWHISLSSWFRDYLYIPLGGNRKGRLRAAANKFIVFALCGLWHGAAWTFLLWGAWHGALCALESLQIIPVRRWNRTRTGRAVGHIYTLLAVCFGFVLFRAERVGQGLRLIAAMFSGFATDAAGGVLLHSLLNGRSVFLLLLAALLSTPIARTVAGRFSHAPDGTGTLAFSASCLLCALLFPLCILALSSGGFSPFIYFQF